MAPAFSFAIVIAFFFAVAQSAELGKAQNQFRSFLNNDLLAKAKAGYTPTADVIPGTELLMDSNFVSGGSLHVTKSFESSCTVPYQTNSLAAGSCVMEGSVSYRFQMASADSCAGATVQYFYDEACTLFAGSSEISLASQSCHASAEGKTFTALTCNAEAAIKPASLVQTLDSAPSAEPTAAPTASPTSNSVQIAIVQVQQTITGVTLDDYLENKEAFELTIKDTVAASMDGVTPDDVTINSVTAVTSSVASLLRGVSVLTTGGITVDYTVRVVSQYTSEQLFSQLTAAVSDGSFNANLQTNAAANGATGLENATAEEPVDVTPEHETDDELSGGAAAAIAIGVVFGVLLTALVIYYFAFVPAASSAAPSAIHAPVPTEL